MEDICFGFGLLILAAGICFAIKNQKRIDVSLRILSITVVLVVFVLLMPIVKSNIFIVFVSALQAGSMNSDYLELLGGVTGAVYQEFLSIMFAITPIVLGGAILSFFENEFSRLICFLLEPFKKACYFSQLNERSLILARSLKKESTRLGRSYLIVFCNSGGGADEALLSEARGDGFVIIKANECSKIGKRARAQYFFQISRDEDLNLISTRELINSFGKRGRSGENIKIYLFSSQIEAELLLNATDKQGVEVMLINDAVAAAYDLMFNRPLFEALPDGGDGVISVLIAGAGVLGREILKAILWCGQLGENYRLKIKVIDKDADYHRSVFASECPEIMSGEYDIEFITADVNTSEFESALEAKCADCNYIVVCLGDDEQSIKTAIALRGHYLRATDTFDCEPMISVIVRSDIKSDSIRELTAINREGIIKKGWDIKSGKAENYNLYPFGSYSNVYSYEFIMASEIEKLAVNGHAVYEMAFSSGKATRDDIRGSYNVNEINKRSSRANAIHIKYKLYSLGFVIAKQSDGIANARKTDAANELVERLNDPICVRALTRLEHRRWIAFQRTEGYRGARNDQAQVYKEHTGSHRHLRAKMHACICPWEELEEVARLFDPNLKLYDEYFIKCIPQMLGIIDDSTINISRVSYAVEAAEPGLAAENKQTGFI